MKRNIKKVDESPIIDKDQLVLDLNCNFGKIPDYIKQYDYENQTHELKNIYMEHMNLIPYGKRLVSEAERLETIVNLKEALNSITETLDRFPIMLLNVHRSERLIKQKEILELKYCQIKDAIEVYNRPPVFVNLPTLEKF